MTLPTTTPTSPEALALHYMAKTVAESSTFQTWVGAGDASSAEANIWIRDTPGDTTRPLVVVNYGLGEYPFRAVGESNLIDFEGELEVFIEANVAATTEIDDGYYEFLNNVGAIRDEIGQEAGKAGFLNIVGIQMQAPGPILSEEKELDEDAQRFWQVVLRVRFM